MCIENHIALLKDLDEAYYHGDALETDDFYDKLKKKCKEAQPEHAYFVTVGTPVQAATPWETVKHSIPMGSISNVPVDDEKDFVESVLENTRKWWEKLGSPEVLVQHKLDGISVNVEYQDDIAKHAILRNDGTAGEDVLRNLKHCLPELYDKKELTNIRCEVLIFKENLEKINRLQEKAGDKPYANCRNAVAGITRRFDGLYKEYLSVLAFDVSATDGLQLDSERLNLLSGNLVYSIFTRDWKKIESSYRIAIEDRDKLDYVIDGMVIKVNELAKRYDNSTRPDWIRAMKFPPEAKSFRVDDIQWFVGKTGHVTPVAINIQGVQFQDKVVRNVTLHNYNQFCNHKLAPGDKISAVISGDVIPKIESVLSRSGDSLFEMPKICPECNTVLRIDGKFLVCDSAGCPGRVKGMINSFITAMGIDEVGDGTVDKLYELGQKGTISFNHFPDLFGLTIPDMLKVEGYAMDSAKKVIDNIQKKKSVTLAKFVSSLSIPGVGKKAIEKLGVESLDDLTNMTLAEMIKKPGIGNKTACNIKDGLDKAYPLIGQLMGYGVHIIQPTVVAVQSNLLEGKSYCFTGDTEIVNYKTGKKYTRDEIWDMVKQFGGVVKTGVSKKLDNLVLVDIDSQTSKASKAREYGINIITDIEFFKNIGTL